MFFTQLKAATTSLTLATAVTFPNSGAGLLVTGLQVYQMWQHSSRNRAKPLTPIIVNSFFLQQQVTWTIQQRQLGIQSFLMKRLHQSPLVGEQLCYSFMFRQRYFFWTICYLSSTPPQPVNWQVLYWTWVASLILWFQMAEKPSLLRCFSVTSLRVY